MLHGVIEGIADDQILIRFTHIDPSDPGREFSLVMDVSNKTYKGERIGGHLSLREGSRALSPNKHTILTNPSYPGRRTYSDKGPL